MKLHRGRPRFCSRRRSKMRSSSHHASTSRSRAGWSGTRGSGAKGSSDTRSILARGRTTRFAAFSPGYTRSSTEGKDWDRMATTATESTFDQEVLASETPVLVDFWAEWCGPCHAVSPVLERIVEERNGDLKLVKVNIDEEQELARRYGIMSIPAMILFKEGEPAAATIGAQPKGAIERALGLVEDES